MKYLIGIDGGGTKTQVVLADTFGNLLTNKRYGSTNPNAISNEELRETFRQIFTDIEEVLPKGLNEVGSVFAGVAGAGIPESALLIKKIISPYFSQETKVKVVPDSINALYSGTFGKPGIVQISGTGSITYGVTRDNRQARIGGWGYLLGDEGSGYDVGRKGIAATLQYVDGLGPKTVLLDKLFAFYNVQSGRELIDKFYQSESPRLEISQVSKLVFEAFEEKDLVAVSILRKAADEISQNIKALDQKLFKEVEKVDVILCGGLFSNKDVLPKLLHNALIDYPKRHSLILPEVPPVAGSVVGAYLVLDIAITSEIKENLSNFANPI